MALGGGGARGLAHLGVLKVLEDAKIPIHLITGTSLGALMGGLYASRPDADYWLGRVEQFLRGFNERKNPLEFIRKLEEFDDNCCFFNDMANLVRKSFFWGVIATKSAFISEKDYEEFIYPLIPDMTIEELKIPFGCVAAEIGKALRVLYTQGSLRRAVSASCALPGIFPPVRDGNQLLVDGGWVECLPARCARDMGAKVVISVDVSGETPSFSGGSGLDVVIRSDAVTRIYLNNLLLAEADVLIRPNVSTCQWADFSLSRVMFASGEAAAREMLPAIQEAIQKARGPRKTLWERLKLFKNRVLAKNI